jgi:hypothetical protein
MIDESRLLCAIYNATADGGPVATPENLQFVQTPFLVEAVREAIPHLREDAAAVAQSWLDRQGGSNV